jgi:hypothetical protein
MLTFMKGLSTIVTTGAADMQVLQAGMQHNWRCQRDTGSGNWPLILVLLCHPAAGWVC